MELWFIGWLQNYLFLRNDVKNKQKKEYKRISNGDDVSNYSDETRTAIENYISVFKNICLNTKGFPDAANDILEIK